MGGDEQAVTTTTQDPWQPAQGYLKELMAGGQDIFRRQTTQDFTKDYIGMSDQQRDMIANLQGYYGLGGGYEQQAGKATSAWENLLRDPSEVAQSPEIAGMIEAMTNPMVANLQEQMLPSVRAGATGAGQFGSTRQGVAEGVAMGKTQQAMGDVSSNVMGNVYQQALQAQLQATGMAPMMTELGAGGQRQAFDLAQLLRGEEQEAADVDYWNRTQAEMVPYRNWMEMLLPISGQGGTSTMTAPTQGGSALSKGLGAGMTGLGAYSTLAGMGGAAAGAATPVGWMAGLAALLGTL